MAQFQVGDAELKDMAGKMVATNEDLQDQGRQLAQAVDSVQGAWSGQAAESFTILMTQYSDKFKKLNDSLFVMAESVAGSADAYRAQEDAANADISAITATLDNG